MRKSARFTSVRWQGGRPPLLLTGHGLAAGLNPGFAGSNYPTVIEHAAPLRNGASRFRATSLEANGRGEIISMFSSSTGNGARLARTLVGSTTLAGLLWAAPGLAHASTEEDPGTACPFNRTLCLFEGADYSGERFTVQSLDPSASVCVDLVEHGWGNRARSAVNTAARTAALFPNPDCTGRAVGVTDATPSLPFQPQSVQVY